MKSDVEILNEYVDKYEKDFYERLSMPEQILYKCQVRDTYGFNVYLLKYKITEFCEKFIDSLKKIIKKVRKIMDSWRQ